LERIIETLGRLVERLLLLDVGDSPARTRSPRNPNGAGRRGGEMRTFTLPLPIHARMIRAASIAL
jgi:hypothetical protein